MEARMPNLQSEFSPAPSESRASQASHSFSDSEVAGSAVLGYFPVDLDRLDEEFAVLEEEKQQEQGKPAEGGLGAAEASINLKESHAETKKSPRERPSGEASIVCSFRRNRFVGSGNQPDSSGHVQFPAEPLNPDTAEPACSPIPDVSPMVVYIDEEVPVSKREEKQAESAVSAKEKPLGLEEFEEDMMGEAREWALFSAKSALNEDADSEPEDEFPITVSTDRVRLKEASEKQFSSMEHTESRVVLQEKPGKKGQKIDLMMRKMVAEAKMEGGKGEYVSIPDPPEERKKEEDEGAEWNRATSAALESLSQAPKDPPKTVLVRFREIWPAFETVEVQEVPATGRNPSARSRNWLCRCCLAAEGGEMEETLQRQIRIIHSLQQLPLSSSPRDFQLLQSVWKLYTQTNDDCHRFGSHWEALGFQGTDPATDLRSMGVFGLLQILFLVSTFQEEALTVAQFAKGRGNFPFAAVSLNMSKIAVEALREERLHRIILREKNVYDTVSFTQVNFFYSAVFLYWSQLYQRRHCDVSQVGFLNKEVAKEGKRHPERMLRLLQQGALGGSR